MPPLSKVCIEPMPPPPPLCKVCIQPMLAFQGVEDLHDLILDDFGGVAGFRDEESVHVCDDEAVFLVVRPVLECDELGVAFFGGDFDDAAQRSPGLYPRHALPRRNLS